MNAVKSVYETAPDSIPVPKQFQNKAVEVIFLTVESERKKTPVGNFYGALPDFPERAAQGTPELRENFQ